MMQSWNIEANPGHGGWTSSLSVCHWNLNSISVKLSQISAFLNVHWFDIFCITETFLDSLVSSKDPRLAIIGHKLFRCIHPSKIWRSEVCLYFKDHLPLASRLKFITLDECLVCEIQNGFKRFFITVLYRSPSRASSNFLYSNQGWRKQSLILMIALLLLQCMLDILMPRIQSDEMVILLIWRVPSLQNWRHNIV